MMVRTRNARREEVTTPNPAPTDERAEMESPQAPPLPPPALSEIPRVETHPAVVEARSRLADAEEKLVAAARRVSELTEQTEAARDRLRELEKLRILDEASDQDVEAARADLTRLEPQLAEAQAVARSWRDAVEDLMGRVRETEAKARVEVEAARRKMHWEAALELRAALRAVYAANHRVLHIEDTARIDRSLLPAGRPLALGVLIHVNEGVITNADLAFFVSPLDGKSLVAAWAERFRLAGYGEPDLEPASLHEVLPSRGA